MEKKKITALVIILIIAILLIIGIIALRPSDSSNSPIGTASWNSSQTVNPPTLLPGMTPVAFEEGNEEPVLLEAKDQLEGIWYDYISQEESTENGGTSKWANAMTKDGSLWVWIPRFAYKIDWNEETDTFGKIDVVFLNGTTYSNKAGEDVRNLGYKVHPAFQDGTAIGFQNGEWDSEITGIWISKFEAGFAGQDYTASENVPVTNTDLLYERNSKNVYGDITNGETYMTYPVFMGKTYSYNNIEIGEMFSLSQALTAVGNPYGFDDTTDSHLLKNSEWGAVAYLAHSQYGRNGSKISINNLDSSKATFATVTITGYGADTVASRSNEIDKISSPLQDSYNEKSYAWYTEKGKLASTTGNQYGIFDMNGGSYEYVAAYIENIEDKPANQYAKSMTQNRTSNKYYTIYQSSSSENLEENYEQNQNIFGDAIFETSKKGRGYTSWFEETSTYIAKDAAFFLRSGEYSRENFSGLFDFTNHSGHSFGSYSFHTALIQK